MPTISGTVKDASAVGIARLVRAYRHDTGVLQATTTSDASGNFSLTVPSSLPHRVVCEDAVLDSACKLLMHFDGANNGVVFTEETGKAVTVVNAVTSTTKSKYGGASGYFNGTNAYISVPSSSDLLLADSDFCIEFDCALAAYPGTGYSGVLSKYVFATSGRSYSVDLYSDGTTTRFAALLSTTGNSAEVLIHALTAATLGQFYHIEVSRSGSAVYFFIDGVLQGSTSVGVTAIYSNTHPLTIGVRSNYAGFTNVYVDELRIRKTAGHTSGYSGSLQNTPFSLLNSYGENALVFDSVVPV